MAPKLGSHDFDSVTPHGTVHGENVPPQGGQGTSLVGLPVLSFTDIAHHMGQAAADNILWDMMVRAQQEPRPSMPEGTTPRPMMQSIQPTMPGQAMPPRPAVPSQPMESMPTTQPTMPGQTMSLEPAAPTQPRPMMQSIQPTMPGQAMPPRPAVPSQPMESMPTTQPTMPGQTMSLEPAAPTQPRPMMHMESMPTMPRPGQTMSLETATPTQTRPNDAST